MSSAEREVASRAKRTPSCSGTYLSGAVPVSVEFEKTFARTEQHEQRLHGELR